jgi:hypothetical protein
MAMVSPGAAGAAGAGDGLGAAGLAPEPPPQAPEPASVSISITGTETRFTNGNRPSEVSHDICRTFLHAAGDIANLVPSVLEN